MVIFLEQCANNLHKVQLMPLPSHHILLHYNPDWFNLFRAFLLGLFWKKGCSGKRPLNGVCLWRYPTLGWGSKSSPRGWNSCVSIDGVSVEVFTDWIPFMLCREQCHCTELLICVSHDSTLCVIRCILSLAFLVSDIAIFVLKRDVKLQLTDYFWHLQCLQGHMLEFLDHPLSENLGKVLAPYFFLEA